MTRSPEISVIMGVFNDSAHLSDAIESILAQTYENFEFIICDDGSTDGSFQIMQLYAQMDDRIIVLQNKQNRGLSYALNRCLKHANGKYIARMDGDDICRPERLETELQFLESHSKVSIVGSNIALIDDDGAWSEVRFPQNPKKEDLKHGVPFCHGSVLVRREAYEKVGGYSEERKHERVEDYFLWTRMYEEGLKGYNIQDDLYSLRVDRAAVNKRKMKYRVNEADVIIYTVNHLHLNPINYLRAIRPLILGLIPKSLYYKLYRIKHRNTERRDVA